MNARDYLEKFIKNADKENMIIALEELRIKDSPMDIFTGNLGREGMIILPHIYEYLSVEEKIRLKNIIFEKHEETIQFFEEKKQKEKREYVDFIEEKYLEFYEKLLNEK